MTKWHNFANSTWQTGAIMKIVFRLYLDDFCFLINAKFRTKEHNYTEKQTTYFTSIIHRFNPKRYREKCRSTERSFFPRLLETLSFVHFLGDLNLSLDNNSPRLIRLVFLLFLFYSDDDDDDDVTTS